MVGIIVLLKTRLKKTYNLTEEYVSCCWASVIQ